MYNILVCDDEKEITDAVEIYLTQEGYQVFKAYDGNQEGFRHPDHYSLGKVTGCG